MTPTTGGLHRVAQSSSQPRRPCCWTWRWPRTGSTAGIRGFLASPVPWRDQRGRSRHPPPCAQSALRADRKRTSL